MPMTERICELPYECKKRHDGMTLVELLVVLAIITAIMAITFPVFLKTINNAQRTSCLTSMHQVAQSLELYLQDYDSVYPAFTVDPASRLNAANPVYWHDRFCQGQFLEPGQVSWNTLTKPYSTTALFYCPADKRHNPPTTSYEYKMWLALGHRELEIPSPSQMAMLWEQWSFHIDPNFSEHDRRSRLNLAFADGHVHPVDLDRTTSARYGTGPDLHWLFVGDKMSVGLGGKDVTD